MRRASAESIGLVALVLLAPAALIYLSFNAGGYFPSAPGFVAIVFAQALVLRTTLAARPFEGFSRGAGDPARRAGPLRRLPADLGAVVARHRTHAGQL